MGTRGVWGLRKDSKDKLTYNHYDSYPSALGETIKVFISKHSLKEISKIFDNIILVNKKVPPTKKQIEECNDYCDLSVSNRSSEDWYCLLREAQGNPEAYFKGLKYMEDNHDFIQDSLFCEWGYIINLDTKMLEIYRGFQKTFQNNRYKINKPDKGGYYNCALVKEIPLDDAKSFNMRKFEESFHED